MPGASERAPARDRQKFLEAADLKSFQNRPIRAAESEVHKERTDKYKVS